MSALQALPESVRPALRPTLRFFSQPVRLFRQYDATVNLRPDLIAGLTVAVVMLPQAIAFALLADLPPAMGLYAAVVGSIVGALWGSSDHVHTGPTNANSLLVFSALISAGFAPGTADFLIAAGLMAVMAGVFQLGLGLARLGVLVNFVSYSVIVGFSAGAGVLIAIKQIEPLLGVAFEQGDLPGIATGLVTSFDEIQVATAAIGLFSIAILLVLPRISRKLPAALVAIVVTSMIVLFLDLRAEGVSTIGELPRGLPPLVDLPILNLDFISRLSTGALAVGAIGLVQTIAMARSIATQTGQRVDSNQEFVGQGVANVAVGFFSGFASAGSFSRSAVNLDAGAKSPVAAVLSGVFVLAAMFLLAEFTVYLPRAALAGVLIVIGFGLVDTAEIRRIWEGTRSDAIIMMVTFASTLLLPIEFAVLLGILLSFAHYTLRTSMPRVQQVVPDAEFHHFVHDPEMPLCPQLGVVDILGDLYFGAVNHIEEKILQHFSEHPDQRYLLVRMNHVNHCDFSGIHMLENVVRAYRDAGGDVFFVRVADRIMRLMETTGFFQDVGADNFLEDDEAIGFLFHRVIDPAICIYECPVRVFNECQNLPKRLRCEGIPPHSDIPKEAIFQVSPRALWRELQHTDDGEPPLVIDVREPREYNRGHIPGAELIPLPTIMSEGVQFPSNRPIVLVCRSGRRSQRAAVALQRLGLMNVSVVRGGMVGWEAEDLLEAIE